VATAKTIVHQLLCEKPKFNFATKDRYIIEGVTLTPENARKILDKYNYNRPPGVLCNRPFNVNNARRWATIIKSGGWLPKCGYVHFSTEGWMTGSQHRLEGCIIADMPIVIGFEFGSDLKDIAAQNVGVPTATSFELSTWGISNSSRVAPILSELLKIEKGTPASPSRPVGIEMLECYKKHKAVFEQYVEMYPKCPPGGSSLVAAVIYAAMANPKAAKKFSDRFLNKEANQPGDVCISLIRGLNSNSVRGSTQKRNVIYKTLNAIHSIEKDNSSAKVSVEPKGFTYYRDKRFTKGIDVPPE
jgi:hypothetical protein